MSNSFVQRGGSEMNVPRIVRAVVILALLLSTLWDSPLAPSHNLLRPGVRARASRCKEVCCVCRSVRIPTSSTGRTIELTASQVMEVVYDRLVYIDDEGLPQPWIAESWRSVTTGRSLPSRSGGYRIPRRHGCHANAVKFCYDRILDPEMAAPYKSFVETFRWSTRRMRRRRSLLSASRMRRSSPTAPSSASFHRRRSSSLGTISGTTRLVPVRSCSRVQPGTKITFEPFRLRQLPRGRHEQGPSVRR